MRNLFYGKVKNGEVILHEPEEYKKLKETLEGKMIELKLEKYREARTLSQNNYYWLVLEIIGDHTGEEPEILHEIFKKMFIRPELKRLGTKAVEITGSTTKLSIDNFVDYTEKVRNFANQELGCFCPLPGEYEQFLGE